MADTGQKAGPGAPLLEKGSFSMLLADALQGSQLLTAEKSP